jgi:YbbR domain-containing protein
MILWDAVMILIERLRRNFGYKLLSFFLAILLYFIASAQRNPSQTISLSVQPEVINLPADLALKIAPRAEVVTLSGSKSLLENARRRLRASIDAREAKEGKSFLAVQYELPEAIKGRVEVTGASTLEVHLERKVERMVAVKVQFENQPPAGFSYRDPTAQPSSVKVTGLASDVERVVRVVANLNNSDGAGAVERTVPVVAQDERDQVLGGVTIEPTRVHVALTLRKAPATKSLILSAELSGTPDASVRVSGYRFSPASVTVRGEISALAALSSLSVPISVEKLRQTTTQRLTITPPPGIELVGAPQVSLTIDVQPQISTTSEITKASETKTTQGTPPPNVP